MTPAPTPWATRPATSIGIDCAAPPIISPSENRTRPARNGVRVPRRSAASPARTMPRRLPRKNPEKTQPYSPSPPRSSATTGMTVAMASASNATSVMVRTRPAVRRRRAGAHTPSPAGAAGSRPVASRSVVPAASAVTGAMLSGQPPQPGMRFPNRQESDCRSGEIGPGTYDDGTGGRAGPRPPDRDRRLPLAGVGLDGRAAGGERLQPPGLGGPTLGGAGPSGGRAGGGDGRRRAG